MSEKLTPEEHAEIDRCIAEAIGGSAASPLGHERLISDDRDDHQDLTYLSRPDRWHGRPTNDAISGNRPAGKRGLLLELTGALIETFGALLALVSFIAH